MKRSPELVFIDNGLISEGEHSYSLIKKVCEAAARRRLNYRVFGTKRLTEAIKSETGAIPHFTRSLYESTGPGRVERLARSLAAFFRREPVDRAAPSERATAKALNEAFHQDLDALPADVWHQGNLIVVPAISQNQILGLVRCLREKPQDQVPRVICQLMFAPGWLPWGRASTLGKRLYRKAFRLAAPLLGRSLFFTAENEAMAALYRQEFGIATKILPIPLGVPFDQCVSNPRPRLGFFGYSKSDKGFHLLPEAIAHCRREGLDAEFVVQIQHGGWEQATIAADRELRAIPDIVILDGILNGNDYAAWASRMDAILLPYDPATFGLRGSGIFTESVAAGRPIIASAGTFAGESVMRGEAEGEVFSPYGSLALADAIARLLPRLSICRAQATVRAKAFAQKHSADAYLDVILSHAKN